MRLIDADALEELFRAVIFRLAKNPDISGDIEHMIRASATVIEMIQDAPSIEVLSAQQWIPCSERSPDQNGKYLVVGRQKAINILKFDGGRWYGKWGVVAWMPLPSPYREETES